MMDSSQELEWQRLGSATYFFVPGVVVGNVNLIASMVSMQVPAISIYLRSPIHCTVMPANTHPSLSLNYTNSSKLSQ
jgi:hypothetical protein